VLGKRFGTSMIRRNLLCRAHVKTTLISQRISTRTVIPPAARKNTKRYIEQGQDATLRGAKDDLNLKENLLGAKDDLNLK
jgi:hypothetical protein